MNKQARRIRRRAESLLLGLAVAMLVFAVWASPAVARESANYRIPADVLSGGGGSGSSAGYLLTGTVGQPTPAGASLSSGHALSAGYWYVVVAVPGPSSHWGDPVVTPTVMLLYGQASKLGRPLEVGDEIAAFDSTGNVLAGRWVVAAAGQYGAMAVYGDDGSTGEKDGLLTGEQVRFRLWSASEQREYRSVVTVPSPVTFAENAMDNVTLDFSGFFERHFGSDPTPQAASLSLGGVIRRAGVPADVDDEVVAYCVHPVPGTSPVKWEKRYVGWGRIAPAPGQLSATTIYGDDPATPDVVEGCAPGEEIQLVLWSNADGKEYRAYLDNATGNPARVVWTGSGDQIARDLDFLEGNRIPLRHGAWNLLSHGVLKGYYGGISPPGNPQLAGVAWEPVASMGDAVPFKSIEGRYDRVLANDGSGATVWNPGLPQYSTLRYLGPGYGYWIKMKPSADGQPLAWMTVPGAPAAGSESLALNTGWTLTGYWGNARTYFDNSASYNATGELLPVSAEEFAPVNPIGEIWSSIAGSYVRVTSFDGVGAHLWNPSLPQTRTLKYLGPGYGYWIKMNAPATLSYPAGTR